MKSATFSAAVVILLGALPLLSLRAAGCVTVSGSRYRVQVATESAVIVWNASTHTEHFIRRATFHTSSPDFGYLVPTPSVPAFAEAGDKLFAQLEEAMQPERREEVQTGYNFTPLLFRLTSSRALKAAFPRTLGGAIMSGSPVRVLDTASVAGYDVTVLEADDPDALNRWLGEHGYEARPAIADWLAPYVAAHWKISAFKFSRQAGAGNSDPGESDREAISSSAIRMSFQTEQPFFPYREPADQRSTEAGLFYPDRLLRVFLLSADRMDGTLGANASAPWPGRTIWTDRLRETYREPLASRVKLSPQQMPAQLRMTVLEDWSSPRPGTDDIYFSPSADQSRIVPPPIVTIRDERIPVPLDLVAVVLVAIVLLTMLAFLRLRRAPRLAPYRR